MSATAAEARRLLAEGRLVVSRLKAVRKWWSRRAADDLGKQAVGIWAQAQAQATLALVEQQRIGNLITLIGYAEQLGHPDAFDKDEALYQLVAKELGLS